MKSYLKVGISGVRGVVGDTFTPQAAHAFARAFASWVGRGLILVGRDTRPSGHMLELAVIAGIQSAGCRPMLVGIVPTPTLLLLTRQLRARGAVAITASHNAEEWNALKFADHRGLFLEPARAREFFDIYHQGHFTCAPEHDIPEPQRQADPMQPHQQKILRYVNTAAIRQARLKVAVDCCNGVGAIHTRDFLEALGCQVATCCDQPTGQFERPPEPLPENLGTLSALVRTTCADIGFAQDPDGDRLAIVDENGAPIVEDLTVALAVRQVLDAHAHGPVVIHLATSRCVEDVATARQCPVQRTAIGEINVTRAMLDTGAVVGGEGNGGVIIPAIHPCRDSYAAMAVILELLATSGESVSALRTAIPAYALVKEKLVMRSDQAPGALRALRRHFSQRPISLLDGVHISFDNAWLHVRRSNTEAVLRITAEAPDQAAASALVSEARALVTPFAEA